MTTPHPADTAKPGDAFRDEDGVNVVDAEVIDPSNPAQLRLVVALLDELRASGEMDGYQGSLAVIARELSIRADRLDADTADRELAEKIAREAVPPNAWVQFDRLDGVVRESRIQTALAGIRAGRDAERGA